MKIRYLVSLLDIMYVELKIVEVDKSRIFIWADRFMMLDDA